MKSYKQLKEQLQESLSGLNYGSLDDGGVNLYAIEDSRVLEKINYALQKVNDEPASDPNSRLVEIKKVLALAALDFDHTIFEANEDDPVTEIPLTQFGGRKGFTPQDGYVDDDGISHRTGGIKYGLRIEATKGRGGLWSLDAKVMPLEMTESLYHTHGSHLNESPMGMGGMGMGAQQSPKPLGLGKGDTRLPPPVDNNTVDWDAWYEEWLENNGGDASWWGQLGNFWDQGGFGPPSWAELVGVSQGNPNFNWGTFLQNFSDAFPAVEDIVETTMFGNPAFIMGFVSGGGVGFYYDQDAGQWVIEDFGGGD